MTPLETARAIVDDILPPHSCGPGGRRKAVDAIHAAIINATNAEVDRRRTAEAQVAALENILRNSVRVVAENGRAWQEYTDSQGNVHRWDGVCQSSAIKWPNPDK